MIGDPETRYREDPVRMLRAVRFAAKLNFSIDDCQRAAHCQTGIHAGWCARCPVVRRSEQDVPGGQRVRSFELLRELGFTGASVSGSGQCMAQATGDSAAEQLVRLGLAGTDERMAADKSVTPAFLFAVLLWPAVSAAGQSVCGNGGFADSSHAGCMGHHCVPCTTARGVTQTFQCDRT